MDDIGLELSDFAFVVVFEEVAPRGSETGRIMIIYCCDEVDARMPNVAVFANGGDWVEKFLTHV